MTLLPARSEAVTTTPAPNAVQGPGGDFGTLRVSATSPVSIVALQDIMNQDFGILAMEMLDESVPIAAQPVFPHLAVGCGYMLSLQVIQTSDEQSSTDNIQFFGADGSPLDPAMVGFRQ